jgi:threonine 3-dehydrogenase
MAVAVVRHAGARHVVVTDLNPYRLDLARSMGATLAVDPRERDLADVQGELGMTEGFDVMFEMSGSAQALRAGIGQMAHGGRIAVLGIPSTAVELDLDPVIFNMLTLKGIYGREMYESWYQMSVMIDSGLDIAPVVTHRFGYSEHAEAFAVAGSGEAGKVLLDWREA